MSKWQVWNKHPLGFTHKEKFRDETIEIKAGGYVLMDYEDAVQFRGQFMPMKKDGMGQPDPKFFKCIELKQHDESAEPEKKKFVSMMDGREFQTQAELDAYVKSNFADQVFKDVAIEEEIEREKKRKTSKAG